ncbi:MAG: lamin tail domain-containing protein [Chitinophagales bacterium]|nr:lamin tail domain-containing protein [Chitinophagales bacterium]
MELRNISAAAIDLSGWIFKDDNDSNTFVIPASTIINSNSNLVLTRYLYDFSYVNPNIANVIGDFNFNLSGSGEWLRIYDASSILKISVHYADTIPFPVEADGEGYTLELKDSSGKMNDGKNWFAGCKGGSPGKYYTDLCGFPTYANGDDIKSFFTLSPTITDYRTTLQYFTNRSDLRILFYDITGREIYAQHLLKDDQSIIINTRDWNNGLLFWNITSEFEKLAVGKLFINH